jgi:hypothetical protein
MVTCSIAGCLCLMGMRNNGPFAADLAHKNRGQLDTMHTPFCRQLSPAQLSDWRVLCIAPPTQ